MNVTQDDTVFLMLSVCAVKECRSAMKRALLLEADGLDKAGGEVGADRRGPHAREAPRRSRLRVTSSPGKNGVLGRKYLRLYRA